MTLREAGRDDAPLRVLVTGASRGIGRAIAAFLARGGFHVTLGYLRGKAEAEAAVGEIGEQGGAAQTLGFDVADREACAEALAADIAEHGAYYGAVLNAGVNADAPFPGMKGEDWDRVLRTNLDGFYNVLHPLVMPMVRARRGGRIVTLSSVSGMIGNRGQANYAASKAGLIGFTKSLARELGPRNVTVNAVAPGYIQTPMTDKLTDDQREALMKTVAIPRLGTPTDVADAIAFLAGPGASYITGVVLNISGGLYI